MGGVFAAAPPGCSSALRFSASAPLSRSDSGGIFRSCGNVNFRGVRLLWEREIRVVVVRLGGCGIGGDGVGLWMRGWWRGSGEGIKIT